MFSKRTLQPRIGNTHEVVTKVPGLTSAKVNGKRLWWQRRLPGHFECPFSGILRPKLMNSLQSMGESISNKLKQLPSEWQAKFKWHSLTFRLRQNVYPEINKVILIFIRMNVEIFQCSPQTEVATAEKERKTGNCSLCDLLQLTKFTATFTGQAFMGFLVTEWSKWR